MYPKARPPPWMGQGAQFPDPPLHVDVVCARAGTLISPTNARAMTMTTIRNCKPTDFVTRLAESTFIQPPSFIAVDAGLQTRLPRLEAQTPHSYCITYCTFTSTLDGEVPITGRQLLAGAAPIT